MNEIKHHLYYSPGACSLAPHICLEETGAPYQAHRVTIANGDQRQPQFIAINPRGRVPALVIIESSGKQVLTESLAIMLYLAQQYPEAKLLPVANGGADYSLVRALEWMSWLGANVHQGTTRAVIRPESFCQSPSALEEIRTIARQRLAIAFADIESNLSGRQWALGETYSAVDAYLLVFFRWGGKCGLSMRQQYPEFTRVMDKVRDRAAVQSVIRAQGIEID